MTHAVIKSVGPLAHPTFQPVNENDLLPELIVTLRSNIPGRAAIARASHHRTPGRSVRLIADDAKVVVDRNPRDRFQLVPRAAPSHVGLCGRIDVIIRVRGVIAFARARSSEGESVTRRSRLWNGQRNGNSGSSGHKR